MHKGVKGVFVYINLIITWIRFMTLFATTLQYTYQVSHIVPTFMTHVKINLAIFELLQKHIVIAKRDLYPDYLIPIHFY